MKMNYWVILGTMLSTSLLAQQATNTAPAAPIETPAAAPAATLTPAASKTNAPAAKSGKKKSGKKKSEKAAEKKPEKKAEKKTVVKKKEPAPDLKSLPLVPGLATVVASNVNVRGQAKLKSEVVTRVTKGQSVTVLEEVVNNHSGPEEPSAWAKILLPPGAHAWINTMYIDAANKTVKPKKLNLRSGPGENYSVIGLVLHGDALKELNTKGDWTEIEPPAGAYAFVAAQYLKQGAEAPEVAATAKPTPPPPAPVAPPPPPPTQVEPPASPTTVASAPAVAPPPVTPPSTPRPVVTAPPPPPVELPLVTTPPPSAPAEPAVPEEPPPPRIVQREGIVRSMTSIQAPSRFVLRSVDNGSDIDYLYSPSTDLDLRRYKGLRVVVTGEEGLDDRWGNTPVITIQKIQMAGD